MAEEEEVRSEVEAVQAVYGEYCHVISDYPPHLTVHVSPRTAEDSSQQFVEVTLGLKADVEYPKKPPYIYILEMKGLDEDRQEIMITKLNNKAQELSSCLMLVALCEEAVESLSAMNHPDGDCPLCLYPLVAEDKSGLALPFMKLMSCYHCFHSECIIRFWKWLQERNLIIGENQADKGTLINVNCPKANCPACRKEFDIKDMEHVLNYLGTSSFQLQSSSGTETEEEAKDLLQSVSENKRRENFESILRKQQENSGLNEPKKNLAILPGMFLPANITKRSTSSETSNEQRDDDVHAEPIKSSENSSKEANINKQRNPRSKPGQYNSKRPMNSNFIPASVLGSSKENSSGTETEEAKDLLQSISDNKRENFESVLKKQQENSGLNDPKKNLAVLPGMYLSANITKQSTSSETSNEQRGDDVHAEPKKGSENSSKEANINRQRNPRSKPGHYNSKRPMNSQPNRKQWVRKDL